MLLIGNHPGRELKRISSFQEALALVLIGNLRGRELERISSFQEALALVPVMCHSSCQADVVYHCLLAVLRGCQNMDKKQEQVKKNRKK